MQLHAVLMVFCMTSARSCCTASMLWPCRQLAALAAWGPVFAVLGSPDQCSWSCTWQRASAVIPSAPLWAVGDTWAWASYKTCEWHQLALRLTFSSLKLPTEFWSYMCGWPTGLSLHSATYRLQQPRGACVLAILSLPSGCLARTVTQSWGVSVPSGSSTRQGDHLTQFLRRPLNPPPSDLYPPSIRPSHFHNLLHDFTRVHFMS